MLNINKAQTYRYMKKVVLSFVIIIFFVFSVKGQHDKDYLKRNVRVIYNAINQELVTKSFFVTKHNIYIDVYNITGSFIKRFYYNADTQVFSNQLVLKQGIYIIKVFDKNIYYTKRIIIK